jgi:hypothetical protein
MVEKTVESTSYSLLMVWRCSKAILHILGGSRPYNRDYDAEPLANDAGVITGPFGSDYCFT